MKMHMLQHNRPAGLCCSNMAKSFYEDPSENLIASLHSVISLTLFLSFDLQLHKGIQNA